MKSIPGQCGEFKTRPIPLPVVSRRCGALAGCLLLLAFQTASGQAMLDRYEWHNRLLLVFSPSEDDERYRRTESNVRAEACRLDDRDLVVGWLPLTGEARLGRDPISEDDRQSLRDRYRVQPGDFTVVLIGKDGTEKDRTRDVPDLDGLFGLIDSMPMRRQEMSALPDPCGD
jgi:hypothetical protein